MSEHPRLADEPGHRSGARARSWRVSLDRWVMAEASVWLIFLAYPIYGVLQVSREHPAPGQVLVWGWVCLLLFAAIYAVGFGVMAGFQRVSLRALGLYLLLLLVPVLLLIPLLGVWTLTLTTYFVAILCFLTPHGRGLLPGWSLVLAAIGWLLAVRPESWVPLSVSLLLGGGFVTISALGAMRDQRRAVLEQRLARASERERIARDVHDLLGHSLTVISLKAEVASAHLKEDASPAAQAAREELRQISEITRSALAEVRATVIRLREPELAGELDAATRALQTAGIDADLPSSHQLEGLTPTAQALFSWGLREGITNVIRHSGAARCTVRITPTELIIDDDGRGTSPSSGGPDSAHRTTAAAPGHRPGPGGSGLLGLRQRVREADGVVVLSASPAWSEGGLGGCGTRLRVSLEELSEEARS